MRRFTLAAGFTCFALCQLVADDARAQVVKCESSDGRTIYTQGACPAGSTRQDLAGRAGGQSSARQATAPETTVPGQRLSPRAAALFSGFEACDDSRYAEPCKEFTEVSDHCNVRANWETPDCAAMREALAWIRSPERPRGEKPVRDDSACHHGLIIGDDSTDADVRACSRARELVSAAEWAQTDLTENAFLISSTVVCLQRFDMPFEDIGERRTIRPTASVRWDVPGGTRYDGYETDKIKGRGFATFEEAAAAGCRAAIEETRAKGGRPL